VAGDEPTFVVGREPVDEGAAQFLDRAEGANPEELHLERAEGALDAAAHDYVPGSTGFWDANSWF
jgi:hypothetical protein